MPLPSDRLDSPFLHSKMLSMSTNKRFTQQNAQLMKFQGLRFLLGIKTRYEKIFFSFLDAKGFKTTPNTNTITSI